MSVRPFVNYTLSSCCQNTCTLGIQIRNSKIDKNIVALSIGCRNKPWTQCFNQNLISSTGWTTSGPAVVLQAALESSAACTTTAGPEVVQPMDEIKFWLKHCAQGLFLQPMLSATIYLSIFEFRICIPNLKPFIIFNAWLIITVILRNGFRIMSPLRFATFHQRAWKWPPPS